MKRLVMAMVLMGLTVSVRGQDAEQLQLQELSWPLYQRHRDYFNWLMELTMRSQIRQEKSVCWVDTSAYHSLQADRVYLTPIFSERRGRPTQLFISWLPVRIASVSGNWVHLEFNSSRLHETMKVSFYELEHPWLESTWRRRHMLAVPRFGAITSYEVRDTRVLGWLSYYANPKSYDLKKLCPSHKGEAP